MSSETHVHPFPSKLFNDKRVYLVRDLMIYKPYSLKLVKLFSRANIHYAFHFTIETFCQSHTTNT